MVSWVKGSLCVYACARARVMGDGVGVMHMCTHVNESHSLLKPP